MKAVGFLLCGAAAAAGSHPIVSVIEKLQKLRRTAKEEGEAEVLAFTKYHHWCGNQQESFNNKIATNKEKIGILEEEIAGAKATIKSLEANIEKLKTEIDTREAKQVSADNIRSDEKATYDQAKKDLEDTIKAIQDAVTGLKNSKSSDLLSVQRAVKRAAVASASRLTKSQHKVIHTFLQQPDESEVVEKGTYGTGGRARKYDFKSGGVIGLLEQLQHDFEVELLETNKAETNAVNGFELAKQARTAAIEAAKGTKTAKEESLTETKKSLKLAEDSLTSEQSDLADNTKSLNELTAECTGRKSTFDERQKTRADEQAAIAQAIEVLEKVSGVRGSDHKKQEKAVGRRNDSNFLQLNDPRAKVVQLIHNAAKVNHSAALERLAQQIRVQNGPFQQIKNMIQKMIFRLRKEQTDEDNHKNWCDTELETTQQSLDSKNDHIAKLEAQIAELQGQISLLEEGITDEENNVKEEQDRMKDETEFRNENRKENAQTLEDAKDAQRAIANAIAVLTDFYKSSGGVKKEAWEFIQEPTTDFANDESFTNTQGSNAVLSLLETVMGDYAKLESETAAFEEEDETTYQKSMSEGKIELARARKQIEAKTARKNTAEEKKASTENQLKKANNQREALEQYQKDLDQPCVAGDSSYEDRKAARAREEQALVEALQVLKDAFNPKSFLARD